MNNKVESFFKEVSHHLLVLNDTIAELEEKDYYDVLNEKELVVLYRLKDIYSFFMNRKYDYCYDFNERISKVIDKTINFKNDQYLIDIVKKEDEIKLFIKRYKDDSYLGTNFILIDERKNYFFNTKYSKYINNKWETTKFYLHSDEMNINTVSFDKKDGMLFDFVDSCKSDDEIKSKFTNLIKFKNTFCNTHGITRDYLNQESYGDTIKKVKSNKQLIDLKEKHVDNILRMVSETISKIDPKENNLGIVSSNPFLTVSDNNLLGHLILECSYIEEINKRLKTKSDDEEEEEYEYED